LHAKHFPPHDASCAPDLYGGSALQRAQNQKKEIAMNRTARAVAFMFVVLGLVASVAPGNAPSDNNLRAMFDGTQPPVPPKAAFLDGTQPPVPPKVMEVFARMLDGTQPPVPPKAAFLDGTQPPVPPKMTGAFAWMFDGTQPPVPPKALAAAV
jgi:hypothetical protein